MRYSQTSYKVTQSLERIKEAQKRSSHIDVQINDEKQVIIYDKFGFPIRKYNPHRTLKVYHEDKNTVKIISGAFGSGKSTGNMIEEIINQACEMPKCTDGIRRARTVVLRNTVKELKETAIDLWTTWCGQLGRVKSRESVPYSYEHNFRDKYGLVHIELWFMAIDSHKQLRDMKSLQLTNALLVELSELSENVFNYGLARIGRYPAKILLPDDKRDYRCHIWADTNAADEDNWMYELKKKGKEVTGHSSNDYRIYKHSIDYEVEGEIKSIGVSFYEQPPAFLENGLKKDGRINWVANPLAENIEFLEGGYGYYFRQLVNGDDFVKVFACGRPGVVKEGTPCHPSFNEMLHAVESIEINPDYELIIGIDFGYDCPAFVVCQYIEGQLLAIKEFWGKTLYIEELYTIEVEPWLKEHADGVVYRAFDDPANTMHGRQQLEEVGFISQPATSNKLDDRLPVVNLLLSQLVRGKPALIISKTGCPALYKGFMGKYVFEMVKIIGEERAKKQPKKTHPYSDVQDALQYCAQSVRLGHAGMKPKDYSGFLNKERY